MLKSEKYVSWCNLERDNAYMAKIKEELGEPAEQKEKWQQQSKH